MMSLLRQTVFSLYPQSTLAFRRSVTTNKSIRTMATAASKQVHRVTLFKIPDSNDVQAVLDKYTTMAQDAKKVCRRPRRLMLRNMTFADPDVGTGWQTIYSSMRSGTGSR